MSAPLLAAPVRTEYSNGSCEDQLSHPGLRRAIQILNQDDVTAAQKTLARQLLKLHADAHVNSFEYILALEPKARDEALARNLGYDDRAALITTYLSRDENARLAAEHVYYLWEDLLTTLTQNPKALKPAQLASAKRQFEYIMGLARTYPEHVMTAWQGHVWDSKQTGPHLLDWTRSRLDQAIESSTYDLKTRKSHHVDPRKHATERNEYVGRLHKILATPTRNESLESLIHFDFAADQRAIRQNRTYAADMAHLFNSEGDNPRLPFGNFLIALQYRMTKMLEVAAGRPRLPSLVDFDRRLSDWAAAEKASREVEQRFVDPTYDLEPDQRAVVDVIKHDPLFRATLFKNSPLTADLVEPRAWLSVLDPARVRAAVSSLDKSSGDYAAFVRNVKTSLGVGPAALATDDVYYTYYPDEIWDALPKGARGGATDPATTIRFAKREVSDLGLGDKTGDCTAVGGVNYSNSLTWWYNSAYQILRFKRAGGWLGKIHVALFEIDRHPALKIDAIEVSPQAQLDAGPQRAEAELALRDALAYVYAMGDRLHRRVYAEPSSNTAWVNKLIYDARDESEADAAEDDIDDGYDGGKTPPPPKTGVFIFDQAGVRRALGLADTIPLKPYYQTAERGFIQPVEFRPKVKSSGGVDPVMNTFAVEIVGAARKTDAKLDGILNEARDASDQATRDARHLAAAKLILADPTKEAAIKTLYALPAAYAVSPKLVVKHLSELAPALGQDQTAGERSGGFVMNSATLLMYAPTPKR